MDNDYWIEKVVRMHFNGYKTLEALEVVKEERKERELKSMIEAWENKAKKEPVINSNGWKYQQTKLI